MISHCPHCGRAVSSSEELVRTAVGWVSTACVAGDGPLCTYDPAERVLNHPFWYVSCINDRGRKALVSGSYESYDAARAAENRAKEMAYKRDPWSAFYSWGVASSMTDHGSVLGRVA